MKVLQALMQSRKFWLGLIGFVVAGYQFVRGHITADQFVDAVVVLVGVLMGAIALEDAGLKVSLRPPELSTTLAPPFAPKGENRGEEQPPWMVKK